MTTTVPVRGRVYIADLGHGEKPFLLVSNNGRNRALGDCLAVRITTSHKRPMTTVVELTQADHPLIGRVLCDDLTPLYRDEIKRDAGALSLPTMMRVGDGLKAALALL